MDDGDPFHLRQLGNNAGKAVCQQGYLPADRIETRRGHSCQNWFARTSLFVTTWQEYHLLKQKDIVFQMVVQQEESMNRSQTPTKM